MMNLLHKSLNDFRLSMLDFGLQLNLQTSYLLTVLMLDPRCYHKT